jgi:hypothetical protein
MMRLAVHKLLCISAVFGGICVLPVHAAAAETASEQELSARIRYWSTRLPYCDYRGGKFPSKYKRPEIEGTVEGQSCEDGDSITFNALTCSMMDRRACSAVSASQAPDGLWWRSPRRRSEHIVDPEGKETIFSNNHALGAMLYILHAKDADAFKNWIKWIGDNNRFLGHIPRYCNDDRCTFKPSDCPLLDRVALALGEANPVCDPLPINLNALLESLQHEFDNVMGELDRIPLADVLVPDRKLVKTLFDETMKPLRKITARVEELRQKHDTFVRALSPAADLISLINAEVNDPGYSQHNVAVGIYLLQKYGGISTDALSEAAHILAAKQPENAFYEFLARGPTPRMLDQILAKCPSAATDKPHARFQWTWERADHESDPTKPQPWAETMYWDCLFVANLYKQGPLQVVTLGIPPELEEVYRIAEQERARLEAILRDAISQANALKHLALLGPQLVLAAGQAMVELIAQVSGILARDRELALLNEISGKLDIVLKNQQRILEEIQALKIFVQESFRNEVMITMGSLGDRYAALSKEEPDRAHRAEFVGFYNRVAEVTGSLGRRDTPAYIAYGAGVTISLAIQHLYPEYFHRADFEETRKGFKAPYDRWLDPKNTEGIVTIVSNTQREIDKQKVELDASPRTVVYQHRSDFCTETTTVTISGDLNSGFTGQATTSQHCTPERRCTVRSCAPLVNEQAFTEREVKSRLLGMLGVSPPAEVVDVPIPQFAPSGFAVVDEMNRKRISIFEMMNRLARQQVMQQQMEKMRDMLAAPLN